MRRSTPKSAERAIRSRIELTVQAAAPPLRMPWRMKSTAS
jgi:hypothetical protein